MRGTKALACSAVFALVTAVPALARAAGTRVVVAGPEGDAIAARLQKELTALGYQPVRVDDTAACAGGSMAAWMDEMHATGATCSDGKTVVVYTASASGVRVADVVEPRADDDGGPDVVAMRAAEVARASIELAPSEPEPAAPKPPPAWSPTVAPQIDAALRDRKQAPPVPHTPSFVLGSGVSALLGADLGSPALDLEMELRVYRRLALGVRSAIPLAGSRIANASSVVKVSPGLFGVGPVLPLAASDAFFVPRVGGGVGVVWLNAQNVFSSSPAGITSTAPTQDDIASPAAYLHAAISMRVVGPLRLAVEGLLGTTAYRMVVRAEGEHVAYWGQPFGTVAMRGELMFR